MGDQDVCDSPTVKTKRFLGVEYDGRKGLIQRNPSYEATIEFIKIAFKSLQGVPADQLAVSAYIEEFDDRLELSEHVWTELLPDLKYITVALVGATSESPQPEEAVIEPETEPSSSEDAAPEDPPTDPPADPPADPLADPPAESPAESETPDDSTPIQETDQTTIEPEIPGGYPGSSVPDEDSPADDLLPFSEMVLCFTGMSSRSRIALFEKAEALGALCDNNLTNRTTHLVAANPEGVKYQWALKLKIPVLSIEWIPDAHSQWLAGQVVDPEESIGKHLLQLPEVVNS